MSDDGFLSRWSRRKEQARRGAVEEKPPVAVPATPDAVPAVPVDAPAAPTARTGVAPGAAEAPLAPLPAPAPAAADAEGAAGAPGAAGARAEEPPPPTLEDVALLPPGADVRRFMAPSVGEDVKRAALKKLFADPHFNVMDGLDTYIEDYHTPRPIPPSVLRKMVQAQVLGLFDDEPKDGRPDAPSEARHAAAPEASPDGTAAPSVPQCPPDSLAVPPDENPDLRLQQDDAAGPGGAGQGPRA